MKIILRSESYVTYDVIWFDIKIVMMHMMYIWYLDHIYVCLIIKHRSENCMTYDVYYTCNPNRIWTRLLVLYSVLKFSI